MRETFIILCIWSIIVGCSQEQKEDDTSSHRDPDFVEMILQYGN